MNHFVVVCLSVFLIPLSFGQDDVPKEMPPISLITSQPAGEPLTTHELSDSVDYKVYNQMGELVDSGSGRFVITNGYEPGTYLVRHDSVTENFEIPEEPTIIIKESDGKEVQLYSQYLTLSIVVGVGLVSIALVFLLLTQKRNHKTKNILLSQIEQLKKEKIESPSTNQINATSETAVDRIKIEQELDKKLNESDWKIIETLLQNPTMSNAELADEVALSVEGTRSALKKLYRLFDIPKSRNMKLTLVLLIAKKS